MEELVGDGEHGKDDDPFGPVSCSTCDCPSGHIKHHKCRAGAEGVNEWRQTQQTANLVFSQSIPAF